jgi:hypothetical protein
MTRSSYICPRLLGVCMLSWIACSIYAQAQNDLKQKGRGCEDDIVGEDALGYQGHKIISVKIEARYLSLPLPVPGTPYSPERVSKIVEDVEKALQNERNREDVEGATEFKLLNVVSVDGTEIDDKPGAAPAIRIGGVTSCVKLVDPEKCKVALGETNPNCVDITISNIQLRLDSGNVWSSFLPNSRSNKPTFFAGVPGPLLALNPKFGIDYDRKFGASETFRISSNLLDLPKTLRSQPLKANATRLVLDAQGKKSQSQVFYDTNVRLSLSHSMSGMIESLGAETGFTANHVPLGDNNFLRNAFSVGSNLKIRPGCCFLSSLSVGANYRRSSNRFVARDTNRTEMMSENTFDGRIVLDGHLGNGVTRLAFWTEAGSPSKNSSGYSRFAAILGYYKEIPVAPNQTVGAEAILGAGRARGDLPQYAFFFGGNIQKNFLYEPETSPILTAFPTGPLLRSIGAGQAGADTFALNGGTSYWHFNLNISIPIREWSSPLVPDIEIDGIPKKDANGNIVLDGEGEPVIESRPLKTLLKNQGASAARILQKIFEKQGLTKQEARAKADRELQGIGSALRFIADQANIYSLKPLVMFDAARIGAPRNLNPTRYAIGAGIQLTIVVAKFEAGYLHTINRMNGDPRGSFMMRLVFQNLF